MTFLSQTMVTTGRLDSLDASTSKTVLEVGVTDGVIVKTTTIPLTSEPFLLDVYPNGTIIIRDINSHVTQSEYGVKAWWNKVCGILRSV